MVEYKKGDRVKHPSKSDWGLGEVLENSNGQAVRIFFVNEGDKTLILEYVQPIKVVGEEAKNVLLDNRAITPKAGGIKHLSLPAAVERFLGLFPLGFKDENYLKEERDYKLKAHELMQELLNKEDFQGLLSSGNYEQVCKRSLRVVNKTNLVFPNEKMALKDGLKPAEQQERFANDLYQLLYGNEEMEERFTNFSNTLQEMEAAKWTIISYFPFICHPDKHMFLKPMISQHAAAIIRFELNYQPKLNWLTYSCLLKFSQLLSDSIKELEPRDMIDVQSFMWCIDPKSY
ncbi:DUF3553 domain-containing protein [endosymbiont of Lamellibrachia barhami]|uniref:DUF3553 domain-containing protein n=1 Tax=endosymbiont of Lamellibrachia barhami TaxID=205975 RepID=UPI0015AC56ED|nr:DUF3553 domain-containing protein [endosymbiont of Lamellibrachia barhami]